LRVDLLIDLSVSVGRLPYPIPWAFKEFLSWIAAITAWIENWSLIFLIPE
jgi:hypothetical protein